MLQREGCPVEKEYPFYSGHTILMDDRFFKLTTDTVLLSYFAQPRKGEHGVDLGAGTGCLGLLCMLRNPGVTVDGVELIEGAAALAERNYERCGVKQRAKIVNADYTRYKFERRYDFCISNPPYFSPARGKASLSPEIDAARRAELEGVCSAAARALKTSGSFYFCLRPERLDGAFSALHGCGFFVKRLRFVHDRAESKASIVLISARRGNEGVKIEPPLILRDQNGYTKEYCDIYGQYLR